MSSSPPSYALSRFELPRRHRTPAPIFQVTFTGSHIIDAHVPASPRRTVPTKRRKTSPLPSASTSALPVQTQRCTACHKHKSLTEEHFNRDAKNNFRKTCSPCLARKQELAEFRRKCIEIEEEDIDMTFYKDIGRMDIDDLQSALQSEEDECDGIVNVTALINATSLTLKPLSWQQRAHLVASKLKDLWGYRFNFDASYLIKITNVTRFVYHCAQRHDRHLDPDAAKYELGSCRGLLTITIYHDSDDVLIKIRHDERHSPFGNHRIPINVQQYIDQHPEKSAKEIWEVVSKWFDDDPPFKFESLYKIRKAQPKFSSFASSDTTETAPSSSPPTSYTQPSTPSHRAVTPAHGILKFRSPLPELPRRSFSPSEMYAPMPPIPPKRPWHEDDDDLESLEEEEEATDDEQVTVYDSPNKRLRFEAGW